MQTTAHLRKVSRRKIIYVSKPDLTKVVQGVGDSGTHLTEEV